jgi:hypothetical protein
MPRPRLILHIGLEKTGTTTLHKFLDINREALLGHHIFHPAAVAGRRHWRLPLCVQKLRGHLLQRQQGLLTEEDVQKLRVAVRRELEDELSGAADADTVILSSELCSSRLVTDEELVGLRDLLLPLCGDFVVVVYIRRQDEYLISLYSTAVQSGSIAPLDFPSNPNEIARYDYWDILSRWARVFGRERILCRRFERSSLISGDIVTDFLMTTGLSDAAQLTRPKNENQSLDASCIEFLRRLNQHMGEHDTERSRNQVIMALSECSGGPLLTMPRAKLAAFMSRYDASNEKLAAEFFPDESGPLFAPTEDSRPRTVNAKLTTRRAIELAAHVRKKDQQTINRLLARVARSGVVSG